MRLLRTACAAFGGGIALNGQTDDTGLDLSAYQRRVETVFSPSWLHDATSELNIVCGNLLLIAQAVSVLIIVAAMLVRIRRDHEQMEGVASTLLLVAFIATVPTWRMLLLDTGDAIAVAAGYRSPVINPSASPTTTQLWEMAALWAPPGTPQLDALEDQSADLAPGSGEEETWSRRGWNWARGVGATSTDLFHNLWRASTGSLRAWFLHLCCAVLSVVVFLTIVFTYLADTARALVFSVGCAALPVFIAGLGVDALRQQSVRFILGLLGVAIWPIAWGIANLATDPMIAGVTAWARSLIGLAMGIAPNASDLPPISVAAPLLAWGVLLLLAAITAAICLWCIGTLMLGPIIVAKVLASGAELVAGVGGVPVSGTASTETRLSCSVTRQDGVKPATAHRHAPLPLATAATLAALRPPLAAPRNGNPRSANRASTTQFRVIRAAPNNLPAPTVAHWLPRSRRPPLRSPAP